MSLHLTRAVRRLAALLAAVAALLAVAVSAQAAEPSARYTVALGSLTAVDETGPDFLGSDEIYAGVAVTDASARTIAQYRSPLFASFDTGNTKSPQADQSCVPVRKFVQFSGRTSFPDARAGDRWTCPTVLLPAGALAAPFSVTAAAFEQETCTHGACNHPDYLSSALAARNAYDQNLGRGSLAFSVAGLAKDFPLPKAQRTYTIEHRGGGAHYRTAVVVTRVQ